MTLSDRARVVGQKINDAAGANLGSELNAGIAEFVGWPFVVSGGRVEDVAGKTTPHFACVVHTTANGGPVSDVIAADNAAVVIDVIENMGEWKRNSRSLTASRRSSLSSSCWIG